MEIFPKMVLEIKEELINHFFQVKLAPSVDDDSSVRLFRVLWVCQASDSCYLIEINEQSNNSFLVTVTCRRRLSDRHLSSDRPSSVFDFLVEGSSRHIISIFCKRGFTLGSYSQHAFFLTFSFRKDKRPFFIALASRFSS